MALETDTPPGGSSSPLALKAPRFFPPAAVTSSRAPRPTREHGALFYFKNSRERIPGADQLVLPEPSALISSPASKHIHIQPGVGERGQRCSE